MPPCFSALQTGCDRFLAKSELSLALSASSSGRCGQWDSVDSDALSGAGFPLWQSFWLSAHTRFKSQAPQCYRTRKCHFCKALMDFLCCAELQGYSSSSFPAGNQDLNTARDPAPILSSPNSQPGFGFLIPQDIFKILILSLLLGAFPKPPIF